MSDTKHDDLGNPTATQEYKYGASASVANNFIYHKPTDDTLPIFAELRAKYLELAGMIEALCPKSREASLAMTNLEQSMFWANAGVARNVGGRPDRAPNPFNKAKENLIDMQMRHSRDE